MKKYLLSGLLLLLLVQSSYTQTSNLDELPLDVLRQRLAINKDDTIKVQLQLALGHLMLLKGIKGPKDIDSAIQFAAQAAALSERLNYDFGIINAMLLNTETLYSRNDLPGGLQVAQKALAYAEAHNNIDGQARSYYLISKYYPTSDAASIGNRILYSNKAIECFRKERNILWLSFMLTQNAQLLFQQERTTEGLRSLFEALNLGKEVSRRTVEGIYWNIGVISLRAGDYTNALKYNFLALKTAKEVNDTSIQFCVVNHLIASTYIKMQDYAAAIPYSLTVLELAKRYKETAYIRGESSSLATEYTHTNQLSKALAVLNEMKSNAVNDIDKLSVTVDFLTNLTYAKSFEQAGEYAQALKKILPKIPQDNATEIMNAYTSLASYYTETGQLKQAYRYTTLHSSLAHKLNYITGIYTAENQYYKLVTLLGNFKSAYGHFLKEKEIKDSIDNIVKAYQISLLDIENEALEKNTHIDSLTIDAQIKDIKLKRHQLIQNVTIAGSVMLLIITALIYSRFRLKQRSNALLMEQKAEIDQKNNALQQLIKDKNELLEDKDEFLLEKDLLLKEVNHRVKNNLHIVMSLLQSQSGYMHDKSAQQAILESQNRVQSIALIHDQLFKTDKTTEIDLKSYITELVQSLDYSINRGNHKVKIDCIVDNLFLDVSQAVPVGIILNELVTNSLKHAFPENRTGAIVIMVKQTAHEVEMRVSDNGIGFPVDFNMTKTDSLGLTLIKGLTNQLKGTLQLDTRGGVTVTIKFHYHAAVA